MFRSILVPLDGSAFGEHALPWALTLASRAGAHVHLVHVHLPVEDVSGESHLFFDRQLDHHAKEHQRGYLDGVARHLRERAGVSVTASLVEGRIAASIRTAATGLDADLLIMTTHGRGPLKRFWLGSVADELVRSLPISLLLLRPGEGPPDLDRAPVLRHLLLPLDGSPLAEQILDPAVQLGRLMHSDFTLLRVVKPATPVNYQPEGASLGRLADSILEQIETLQRQLCQAGQAYLEPIAGRLREQGLKVRTRVAVEVEPALGILGESVSQAADGIAMATHGRHGVSRLFLGSVTDKVLRGTSSPILVRRPVH
jgi:nucleotide-binding universal stress UspA family protein